MQFIFLGKHYPSGLRSDREEEKRLAKDTVDAIRQAETAADEAVRKAREEADALVKKAVADARQIHEDAVSSSEAARKQKVKAAEDHARLQLEAAEQEAMEECGRLAAASRQREDAAVRKVLEFLKL